MSNFSFFPHNVFYSIRYLYLHLSTFLTSYLYLLLNWKSLKLAYFLPDVKILDVTKLKTQDKINVTNITIAVFDRVENTMGKGENAGYKHFPQCFLRQSSLGSLNVGIVW